METYKRVFGMMGILCVSFWAIFSTNALAQESDAKNKNDWKQEITSDKQEIKQDRETNRSHARAAIKEEKDLRDQIHQADRSGDHEKAKALREQMRTTHKENAQEKRQDSQNLNQARRELRSDVKDARKDGALPPGRINPPGYNPPGAGPHNPPGYNPPGAGPRNPPGYNPPGAGPHNPPGYNPPGAGPRPGPRDVRERRNDNENRGDFRDPGRDRRDGRRGDRDHHRGRDDGRRYLGDSRQDNKDRHKVAGQGIGVRDHGAGEGAGKGQAGMHRTDDAKHKNGRGPRDGREK